MITLAYLSDWNFTELPERDAAKLTHLQYSFALIADGRASAAHWQNGDKIREIIRRYPNLKVGLALGGWGADGFSQAMENAQTRQALADSFAELVGEYGFSGVDLDWEYPCESMAGIAACPEDRERFPVFVRLLRDKLDSLGKKNNKRYFMTMAVGAAEMFAENLLFAEMIGCLDYVNLMTYDMGLPEGFSGHHTHLRRAFDEKNPVSVEQSVEIYHRYGVPMEKIVIGAAFYGKGAKVTGRGEHNGLYMPQVPDSARSIRHDEINRRVSAGAKIYWDDTAQAPYLYDESDNFFATFDNERSLREKTNYVRQNRLGGIMFWEYNSDKTGTLLNAVYEGMI
ncbi:MAG: glycosyl hydrolase family 18 protein [Defluviitaleaceae bacterium]|nr:glycosyl hydrolase family 18 protein [Defluviitaleaceae bacterium]MCL2836405.1 glycosyl hydrolase family 18 protein [Defluviitaleaceae bacterium]